jgi:hypothetical protein
VLAHVLNVPVLALFIPVGDTDEFRVTPTLTVDPYVAYRWIDGHLPRVDQGLSTTPHSDPTDARIWSQARQPLNLLARLHAAVVAFESSTRDLTDAEQAGDIDRIDRARRTRLDDLQRGATAFDEVIESGLVPPRLPTHFAEALKNQGRTKYPDTVRSE